MSEAAPCTSPMTSPSMRTCDMYTPASERSVVMTAKIAMTTSVTPQRVWGATFFLEDLVNMETGEDVEQSVRQLHLSAIAVHGNELTVFEM